MLPHSQRDNCICALAVSGLSKNGFNRSLKNVASHDMIDDVNQIHHDEQAEHVEGCVIQYASEYD